MNKPKRGRPSYKTEERVAILLKALERPMPFNLACDFAQIDRRTAYRWLEKDKDFAVNMAFSRAIGAGLAVDATMKKEPWKVLKNIAKEDFKDDPQVAITVNQLFSVKASDREIKLLR